jgi:hypothetical protein
MRSWRCAGFESGAIEASNGERRRHYFSCRAFKLKLPPAAPALPRKEIFDLTKIDRWFLTQIKEIIDFEKQLAVTKNQPFHV